MVVVMGERELKNILEGKEKIIAPYKVADAIFNLYREGKLTEEEFREVASLLNKVAMEVGAIQGGLYHSNEEALKKLSETVERAKEVLYGEMSKEEEEEMLHYLASWGWTDFVPEVWLHLADFFDKQNLPQLARRMEENFLQGPVNAGAWIELIPKLPEEVQKTFKTLYWGYYLASVAQELRAIRVMLKELNIEKVLKQGTQKVLEEILYKLERIESRFDISVHKTNQKVENARMNLERDIRKLLENFAEQISKAKSEVEALRSRLNYAERKTADDGDIYSLLEDIQKKLYFIWKDLDHMQMAINRIEDTTDGIWTELKYNPNLNP